MLSRVSLLYASSHTLKCRIGYFTLQPHNREMRSLTYVLICTYEHKPTLVHTHVRTPQLAPRHYLSTT